MTPGARLQAAIELLSEIEGTRRPADALIDSFFRPRRYAGSKDRRAVAETVWTVLRRRARLDWWIVHNNAEASSRLRVLVSTVLDGIDPVPLFSGDGYSPAALSEAEHSLTETLAGKPLTHPDMPRAVRLECPDWLLGRLEAAYGIDTDSALEALNQPGPPDLRVNTRKGSRDDVRAALAEAGIEAMPTPLSPLGLRLAQPRRLGGTGPYREGLIEFQDEGSQLLALHAGPRPGDRVVDFCAGAGGKSLALATVMNGEGQIIACDTDARRLRRLDPRRERAGAAIIRSRPLTSETDPWVAENAGSADLVLLDVPCTGIGTWRRAPEARWRLTPDRLADLTAVQQRILEAAHRLVAPGGRLVYATCSLLPEENEDQMARFLAAHPEFTVSTAPEAWARAGLAAPCPSDGPFLRLAPHTTGTDGFFIAVLVRSPST